MRNPPLGNDVLFWTQAQREAGFRLGDRLPFLVSAQDVAAGAPVRALRKGAPLPLDIDLDAHMRAQNTAALVVLVDGELRLERYGLGFGPEGRWTSFSVAKSITTTLFGAALQEGAIGSLNDAVTQYLPQLVGSAYDGVTLEHLLTMTSGVDWDEDYDDPASDVATFLDTQADPGEPSLVTHLKRLPRAHAPGTDYGYSTGEANLVGLVVSAATGRPLGDYLSEKIWAPFGMEQKATWLLSNTGEALSGCCVQMATRDLARFGQFILEGGVIGDARVLPEDWNARAMAPLWASGRNDRGYGYQWWTLPGDATPIGLGIFGQGLMVDTSRDVVVAINSNWTVARGGGGEYDALIALFRTIQRAVDAER